MSDPKDLEEFDHIVDEVIGDTEKADRLKKAVHEKLGDKPLPNSKEDGDGDLWDNVPL